MLFEFLKNEIRAVSTDSHRLVYIRREDFYTEGYEGKIIIPQKFLTILLGYLDKEGETVVTLGDNHVKVKLGSTVIYSRLIDEQFPDYEQVIPVANDHVVVGDIKELTSALKRSVVLSDRTTHQISITFDPDVSKIDSVDSETRSSSDEKIHLQYDGEQLEIGYNAYYLIDLLKNVETDEVIFKFRDSKGPSLILQSDQKENEEITMLLMPIMLNN